MGVLAYNADDDYERGQALLRAGAGVREAAAGDRPAPDGAGTVQTRNGPRSTA